MFALRPADPGFDPQPGQTKCPVMAQNQRWIFMETQLHGNRKESHSHETTGTVRLELSVPDAFNASCPLNF